MGMFDNMKDKAGDLAQEHSDKVDEGLDKAGEFVNEKTGGEHGDQIDQGKDFARDQLDNLGGDNQDNES